MVWYGAGERYYWYDAVPGCTSWDCGHAQRLAYWDAVLSKYDKWKFNIARLPFRLPEMRGITGPFNYAEIDDVLNLAVAHNMKIILDLHNGPNDAPGFFGSDTWINYWKTLTMRYKDNPNVVAFELFNEPFIRSSWALGIINDYPDIFVAYKKCTDAVRAIDPTRTVVWSDPQTCNILPKEDGFNGWFGHVIESYLSYVDNMYFAFHAYPPLAMDPTKPWTGIDIKLKAMDYVKNKGFKIWLGEFGALPKYTVEENRDFLLRSINFCIEKGIGFSLWCFENDNGSQPGLYDAVLQKSLYNRNPLGLIFLMFLFFLAIGKR